ncbi:hypothetical protein G7046_g6469 [Stylonectria norvegica]|nr:hypothetical protein G7046_g6469 [Stylonectria norvegica]
MEAALTNCNVQLPRASCLVLLANSSTAGEPAFSELLEVWRGPHLLLPSLPLQLGFPRVWRDRRPTGQRAVAGNEQKREIMEVSAAFPPPSPCTSAAGTSTDQRLPQLLGSANERASAVKLLQWSVFPLALG